MPYPQNLVLEIILPTNAPGVYGDQIFIFGGLGDKGRFWQDNDTWGIFIQ